MSHTNIQIKEDMVEMDKVKTRIGNTHQRKRALREQLQAAPSAGS